MAQAVQPPTIPKLGFALPSRGEPPKIVVSASSKATTESRSLMRSATAVPAAPVIPGLGLGFALPTRGEPAKVKVSASSKPTNENRSLMGTAPAKPEAPAMPIPGLKLGFALPPRGEPVKVKVSESSKPSGASRSLMAPPAPPAIPGIKIAHSLPTRGEPVKVKVSSSSKPTTESRSLMSASAPPAMPSIPGLGLGHKLPPRGEPVKVKISASSKPTTANRSLMMEAQTPVTFKLGLGALPPRGEPPKIKVSEGSRTGSKTNRSLMSPSDKTSPKRDSSPDHSSPPTPKNPPKDGWSITPRQTDSSSDRPERSTSSITSPRKFAQFTPRALSPRDEKNENGSSPRLDLGSFMRPAGSGKKTPLKENPSKKSKLNPFGSLKEKKRFPKPMKGESIAEDDFADSPKPETPKGAQPESINPASEPLQSLDPELEATEKNFYHVKQHSRKLYKDDVIHVAIIEFIIALLISADGFTLEPLYTDQFPMLSLKMNIMYILRLHLNHPANERILGSLSNTIHNHRNTNLSLGKATFLLLKLFCKRLFQTSLLTQFSHIASGAYGKIYACKLLGEDVAVKQMNVPPSIHDRCVPHDIFTEILILDKWKQDERICTLIDFGTDHCSFWIIMKRYRTSLKSWRNQQERTLSENVLLYLNIYEDVLNISRFFSENMVNHFDIKADNFLIECDPSISDFELYNNPTDRPNFKICLADFGESQVYTSHEANNTTENRGTECIKSPEMLTVAYANKKDRDGYDRLRKVGAGPASDIWSLGCLFFELLTNKFLFHEPEWVKFYVRVTANEAELLLERDRELLEEFPDALSFLRSVLIRDPKYRPQIQDMIRGFKVVHNKIIEQKKKDEIGSGEAVSDPITIVPKELSQTDSNSPPQDYGSSEGNKSQRGQKPQLLRTSSSPLVDLVKGKFKIGKDIRKDGDKDKNQKTDGTNNEKSKLQLLRLQQINYNAVQYSVDELKFFRETPTKVTNYLFLGDWSNISQREQLHEYGITHIADCTNGDKPYTDHFAFQKISPDLRLIEDALPLFIPFVKKSIGYKGRVLVTYDDAFGPSLVIGFIMDTFQKTFFEAFQMVYKSRYVINFQATFIQKLMSWERTGKEKDLKRYYECLCGANKWILLQPLDTTEHQNPVLCKCTIYNAHDSICPFIGCQNFLDELEKQNFHDEFIRWGYTTRDNVQGDFEYCEVFSPEEDIPREVRDEYSITSKSWQVHRCRRCNYATHAINETNDTFAIVTNKTVTPKRT